MSEKGKVHFRDIRLFNNAGMELPTCTANAPLLNVGFRGRITSDKRKVTCKHCQKKISKSWFAEMKG